MATILNFNNKLIQNTSKKQSGVLRKPGSNKLYIDLRYHGDRIVKSSGLNDTLENEQKLQIWVEQQKEKITKGIFVFAEAFPGASAEEKAFHAQLEGWEYKAEPQSVLLKDYVEEWMKRFLLNEKSNTKRRDYNQVINYWLLPSLGNKTFYQITGVTIKEFIGKLVCKIGKKEGKPLSASRIRNILIPLRSIWNDACEEHRWNLANPFVHIKKYLPKRSKKHPEVFRFDEWLRVINNMDNFYKPIAEIMIMTGMIGSEIAGLRYEDIEKDRIIIRNSIVRNFEKSDLKTEYRFRNLPLTTAMRKCLEVSTNRSGGKYIFTMKSGRTFDIDSFRKNTWVSALKKSGISYKVPYSIRHSFAAWSLTLRMDPNRLVNLMGHGSKKMIYEVYGRYVNGLEKDVGKILDYFGKDFIDL